MAVVAASARAGSSNSSQGLEEPVFELVDHDRAGRMRRVDDTIPFTILGPLDGSADVVDASMSWEARSVVRMWFSKQCFIAFVSASTFRAAILVLLRPQSSTTRRRSARIAPMQAARPQRAAAAARLVACSLVIVPNSAMLQSSPGDNSSPPGRRTGDRVHNRSSLPDLRHERESGRICRLTRDQGQDDFPAWSPDGRRIAFSSNRSGNYEIYVLGVDGGNPIRLTRNAADDADPKWSPDGRRIAFVSDRSGNHDIYVMNADGTGVRQLTTNPTGDGSPAWSPDGRSIVFASTRERAQLFTMGADGSRPGSASPTTPAPTTIPPGRRTESGSRSRAHGPAAPRST